MALIAQKQLSKRSKHESRRVNTPVTEQSLKRALCTNLEKACGALSGVAFEIRPHPYLDGVLCRSDGACFVPTSGTNKAHWTFGCRRHDGYCYVQVQGKRHAVHRLVCETFHGLCPEDKCQVDHLNRDPSNNRPGNLRWCTPSENCRNRAACLEVMKDVVSQTVDRASYKRSYYANSPEHREKECTRHRAYDAAKHAKMKAQGLTKRKGPDGKWGWYPPKRAKIKEKL